MKGMGRAAGVALIVASLAAACGRAGQGDLGPEGIPHPSGHGRLVLRVATEGGFVSPQALADYRVACDMLTASMGGRFVAALGAEDFAALRVELARRYGPVRLGSTIQRIRSVFKLAVDNTYHLNILTHIWNARHKTTHTPHNYAHFYTHLACFV